MKSAGITLTRIILLLGTLIILFKLPNLDHIQKTPIPTSIDHISIVLSPHFDDAVLSLGGMLATHPEKKIVATFFAGKPNKPILTAWDTTSGFADSSQAVEVRIKENVTALSSFTNTEIKNFDHLDSQYQNATNTDALEKTIRNNIWLLLNEHPHQQIDIYGPSYFGEKITHPDHALLHRAFINVFKEKIGQQVTFYLYEDFPYVRYFEKNHQQEPGLSDFISTYDNVPLTRKVVNIDTKSLSSKLAAIRSYSSQVRPLSTGLHATVDITEEYFAKKRCKNDNPAPYACEVVYRLNR